ncbi:MAG: hypothetical protein MZV63_62765 [Marinilabiliales bacterium]|nr:hypothetical protein [Marinilabiliales bacterium]
MITLFREPGTANEAVPCCNPSHFTMGDTLFATSDINRMVYTNRAFYEGIRINTRPVQIGITFRSGTQ